jgi:hypothetical protein
LPDLWRQIANGPRLPWSRLLHAELLPEVAKELKSDIWVRVATYIKNARPNIGRRRAERSARSIPDRTKSIGRYPRLEALDCPFETVVICGQKLSAGKTVVICSEKVAANETLVIWTRKVGAGETVVICNRKVAAGGGCPLEGKQGDKRREYEFGRHVQTSCSSRVSMQTGSVAFRSGSVCHRRKAEVPVSAITLRLTTNNSRTPITYA